MQLFWERGYENASLADLIGAMDIKGSSLYAAFGSKEALFRECLELYQNSHGLALAGLAARDRPARERLAAFLDACARDYTRPDRPKGCLVVLSAFQCPREHAAIEGFLREKRLSGRERLRDLLAEAKAGGELPPEADLDVLAVYLAAVVQGMSAQARDGEATDRLLAMIPAVMAFWPPPTA